MSKKDWEKYEDQIFKLLREKFPDADISKNQRIKGTYSERSRQIDILVLSKSIGRELKIIIDCKKFSKKIDLKTVESFIGFCEDVGAHVGLMITNNGYSKSAKKRVSNKYHRDIQLEIIEFEKLEEFQFDWFDCYLCQHDDHIPRGHVIWKNTLLFENKEFFVLIDAGDCTYCGELYFRCQDCGETLNLSSDSHDVRCQCDNIFELHSEYIGSGMTEDHLKIKFSDNDEDNFVDPSQLELFE